MYKKINFKLNLLSWHSRARHNLNQQTRIATAFELCTYKKYMWSLSAMQCVLLLVATRIHYTHTLHTHTNSIQSNSNTFYPFLSKFLYSWISCRNAQNNSRVTIKAAQFSSWFSWISLMSNSITASMISNTSLNSPVAGKWLITCFRHNKVHLLFHALFCIKWTLFVWYGSKHIKHNLLENVKKNFWTFWYIEISIINLYIFFIFIINMIKKLVL